MVFNSILRCTLVTRVFRVDRIHSQEFTGETFNRPEDFSVKDYFIRMYQEAEPDGEMINVRLQGSNDLLDQICNQWFLQNYLVERNAEEAQFFINFDTMLKYMPHLLLSFGKNINVLEPAVLRETLSGIVHDLAKYYDTPQLS